MEPALRQKVMTDSRGRQIQQAFTNRLKKDSTPFSENPDAWSEMLELADSSLLKGTLKIPETFTAGIENPMLFTIEKEAFYQPDVSGLRHKPLGAASGGL